MNLKQQPPQRSIAAFTMVEIALCLAIIGFALVAIIGVLPAGMSVQKDNREQTIINFDADFLMDTIRGGAQGQNLLTNSIISITNIVTLCDSNGVPVGTAPVVNWFTTNQSFVNGTMLGYSVLTNGSNIVGLLTTPKYVASGNNGGFYSNYVSADFRALSGLAVDLGTGPASRDFAFAYRVNIEVIPSADYPYNPLNSSQALSFANWVNPTAPSPGGAMLPDFQGHLDDRHIAENLQGNLSQIRLRFRWPILGNGRTGGGHVVFRSSASGTFFTVPLRSGLKYYYVVPQYFKQYN